MLTARAARVGQRTGETCPAGRPAHGNRFAAAGRASRTGGNGREVALGGLIGLSLARKPDHSPLNRPPARRPYEKCGFIGQPQGKNRWATPQANGAQTMAEPLPLHAVARQALAILAGRWRRILLAIVPFIAATSLFEYALFGWVSRLAWLADGPATGTVLLLGLPPLLVAVPPLVAATPGDIPFRAAQWAMLRACLRLAGRLLLCYAPLLFLTAADITFFVAEAFGDALNNRGYDQRPDWIFDSILVLLALYVPMAAFVGRWLLVLPAAANGTALPFRRSAELIKGRSLRLFVLLALPAVLTIAAQSLPLLPDDLGLAGAAAVAGVIDAGALVLFATVLAAVYGQVKTWDMARSATS